MSLSFFQPRYVFAQSEDDTINREAAEISVPLPTVVQGLQSVQLVGANIPTAWPTFDGEDPVVYVCEITNLSAYWDGDVGLPEPLEGLSLKDPYEDSVNFLDGLELLYGLSSEDNKTAPGLTLRTLLPFIKAGFLSRVSEVVSINAGSLPAPWYGTVPNDTDVISALLAPSHLLLTPWNGDNSKYTGAETPAQFWIATHRTVWYRMRLSQTRTFSSPQDLISDINLVGGRDNGLDFAVTDQTNYAGVRSGSYAATYDRTLNRIGIYSEGPSFTDATGYAPPVGGAPGVPSLYKKHMPALYDQGGDWNWGPNYNDTPAIPVWVRFSLGSVPPPQYATRDPTVTTPNAVPGGFASSLASPMIATGMVTDRVFFVTPEMPSKFIDWTGQTSRACQDATTPWIMDIGRQPVGSFRIGWANTPALSLESFDPVIEWRVGSAILLPSQLALYDPFVFVSLDLSSNTVSTGGRTDILAKIPVTAAFGGVSAYQNPTSTPVLLSSGAISALRLRLTHRNGQPVNMQGQSWDITLALHYQTA